jgi:Family of unknown function (DUF6445)
MTELDGKSELHEAFRTSVHHIGQERSPLLVVDDFLSDPGMLVDFAEAHANFSAVTDTRYPGVRAPMPQIYSLAVRAYLGVLIAETFRLGANQLAGELAFFSPVTVRPEQLQTWQRVPHFDNSDEQQLAALHYLSPRAQGGTSFYRHRTTGFEVIRPQRVVEYMAAVDAELGSRAPVPAAYIAADSDSFRRFAKVQGTYNRLIVYRSANLHSPDIPADFQFDSAPRTGRLTASLFFKFAG